MADGRYERRGPREAEIRHLQSLIGHPHADDGRPVRASGEAAGTAGRARTLWFGLLGAFSFVVLTVAAVWMGGLNQDEGWYVYAANLVAEGKTLYRDFFFTQAPMMPIVYSAFTRLWATWGMLGARALTAAFGAIAILFFAMTARRLAPEDRRNEAAVTVFLLLGSNLYHLYYTAIPKTYALAAAFLAIGFYLLCSKKAVCTLAAGAALAFAAGTRISLGAILAVVGICLLCDFRRSRWRFLWFGIGGAAVLALAYGPFLLDEGARLGLVAAQAYHTARGGFDPVFTVGSVSRLVRWYLPTFIVLGLAAGGFRKNRPPLALAMPLLAFLAVVAVQLCAPFPYEDYQVPVMGLLTVFAAAGFVALPRSAACPNRPLLLVLGLCWATAFGSPLLEKWTTNGQDRFWSLKKEKFELAQLQEVAAEIESIDPGGKTLLTQDIYLAIETGRKVPEGLEMGPFSVMRLPQWVKLLDRAPANVAALSGYSFAVLPPECGERPMDEQLYLWEILRRHYELEFKEEAFGQNATPLLVLKKKQ